jgi:D-glycero-D-manno-heptose 1,7-bisphosphate phosphatase
VYFLALAQPGERIAILTTMKYAVFFERDGVLNLTRSGWKQPVAPRSLEEFEINSEAVEPLRELKSAGYILLAITNQPGVSLGTLPRREMDMMHSLLMQKLPLDEIYVCPHVESDRCNCRKPHCGLLIEAAFKWHLDLERSFVVSDKWQDAAAAQVAGCMSVLIKSPWIGNGHHDSVVPSLAEAAGKILRMQVPNQVFAAQQAVA